MKVCKKCGAEMEDVSMFCGTCGTWQDEIQDSKQPQLQDDVIDNRITVFQSSKNGTGRNPIVIAAVASVIIILGYLFFTSKFFSFAMIKRNPLGAFCKAVEKQQDLDSYSSNINLFGNISGGSQQIQIYFNINSKVNNSKQQSIYACSYSVKNGASVKTITGNLYQDADKFYLKIPVIDKYMKSEFKKGDTFEEPEEIHQRAVEKVLDAVKNKISNSDFKNSEETLEINNKKCNVVKISLKLDKKKLVNVFKAALLNVLQDNKLKNYIKSHYKEENFDIEYDSIIKAIKGMDASEALNDIDLSKFEFNAYIDKNNNLVGTKVVTNIEPELANEQGKMSFVLQQRTSDINELDNVNLPSDLSANSKDMDYCLNTYPYSDEVRNYFDFTQAAPVNENANPTVFKMNAKHIQIELAEFHAENDRYPKDKDEFENCMKNRTGNIPTYDDGTEIVAQYVSYADSYNITFNDNKDTSTNEALFSMNDFTNVDDFK